MEETSGSGFTSPCPLVPLPSEQGTRGKGSGTSERQPLARGRRDARAEVASFARRFPGCAALARAIGDLTPSVVIPGRRRGGPGISWAQLLRLAHRSTHERFPEIPDLRSAPSGMTNEERA